MMQFQLYQNPRAGTYRHDRGTSMVTVLGLGLEAGRVRYLIVGGTGIPEGSKPRWADGQQVDIAVVPGP